MPAKITLATALHSADYVPVDQHLYNWITFRKHPPAIEQTQSVSSAILDLITKKAFDEARKLATRNNLNADVVTVAEALERALSIAVSIRSENSSANLQDNLCARAIIAEGQQLFRQHNTKAFPQIVFYLLLMKEAQVKIRVERYFEESYAGNNAESSMNAKQISDGGSLNFEDEQDKDDMTKISQTLLTYSQIVPDKHCDLKIGDELLLITKAKYIISQHRKTADAQLTTDDSTLYKSIDVFLWQKRLELQSHLVNTNSGDVPLVQLDVNEIRSAYGWWGCESTAHIRPNRLRFAPRSPYRDQEDKEPSDELLCIPKKYFKAMHMFLGELLDHGLIDDALDLSIQFNFYHSDLVAVQLSALLAWVWDIKNI